MTKSKNRIQRWIQNSLLVVGVVGLGLWAGANAAPVIWQDWGNWVFDQEIRGEAATITGYLAEKEDEIVRSVEAWLGRAPTGKLSVPSPRGASPLVQRPPIGENGLVGRLAIPRLRVSAIVREGVGRDVSLRQGCARRPESGFLLGQEAADRGSADVKPASDLRFADSLPA
jgi:hypothetical protein